MTIMRDFRITGGLSLILLLASCVTINVYFPAAAAEKAADRIIEQVLGEDRIKALQQPPAPQGEPTSYRPQDTLHGRVLAAVLDFVIPSAHAAGADINVSSPAINKLRASMQARHGSLSPYYKAGAIGFGANGLVVVRDDSVVGLRERGQLKRLVAAENRDRNALYQEIARANGHPEWEDQIRDTFARRWVANAPGGWFYQNRSGGWQQK